MKLKVVIVDLEIPPHVKKWGVRVGVTLAVLTVGAVALAGTPLHVWNTGDTILATDLNGNFSNLQGQINSLALSCTVVEGVGTTSTTAAAATPVTCPTGYVVTGCGCDGTGSNAGNVVPNGQHQLGPGSGGGSLGAAVNCTCTVGAGGGEVAPIAVCCQITP
jgi:hypothetical protein